MAWLLFLDESGHDRGASPYEVLAGIAIADRDIWKIITAMPHVWNGANPQALLSTEQMA